MSFIAGAAAGVALLDFFGSKGQHLSITDNVLTNMSMTATTNVATSCFVSLQSAQTLNIEPSIMTGAQTQALIGVCEQCQTYLNQILSARTALEDKAVQLNGSYTAQQANPSLQTTMQTGGWPTSLTPGVPQTSPQPAAIGPCTAVCANVVVVNTVQQSSLSATQNCTVTNDISNSLTQNIQGQISAYLKNQQDIVGQLESAFTSNTEAISANLGATMSQSVTNNFIEDLSQAMFATQTIDVKGKSVIALNIAQSFTGTMVGNLNVSNTVSDQLRQSASYSIAQSLLNKNDTIGDLSTDFLGVINTMSQLMEELTTQILIIIGAVLAAVFLVMGSLYLFNKNFHSWASHAVGTAADAQLEHYRLMQTDQSYRKQVADDAVAGHQQKLEQMNLKKQNQIEILKAQADVDQRLTENEMLLKEQNNQLMNSKQAQWLKLSEEEREVLIKKHHDEMTLGEKAGRVVGGVVGGVGTGAAVVLAASHGGLFV